MPNLILIYKIFTPKKAGLWLECDVSNDNKVLHMILVLVVMGNIFP